MYPTWDFCTDCKAGGSRVAGQITDASHKHSRWANRIPMLVKSGGIVKLDNAGIIDLVPKMGRSVAALPKLPCALEVRVAAGSGVAPRLNCRMEKPPPTHRATESMPSKPPFCPETV
jgi:hypothetical protein